MNTLGILLSIMAEHFGSIEIGKEEFSHHSYVRTKDSYGRGDTYQDAYDSWLIGIKKDAPMKAESFLEELEVWGV